MDDLVLNSNPSYLKAGQTALRFRGRNREHLRVWMCSQKLNKLYKTQWEWSNGSGQVVLWPLHLHSVWLRHLSGLDSLWFPGPSHCSCALLLQFLKSQQGWSPFDPCGSVCTGPWCRNRGRGGASSLSVIRHSSCAFKHRNICLDPRCRHVTATEV